jgi:hypothetical protein
MKLGDEKDNESTKIVIEDTVDILPQSEYCSFMQGVRHETRKYGPDFDSRKDEATHVAYWKLMKSRSLAASQSKICSLFATTNVHTGTTSL